MQDQNSIIIHEQGHTRNRTTQGHTSSPHLDCFFPVDHLTSDSDLPNSVY
jgi:hypothetical protein